MSHTLLELSKSVSSKAKDVVMALLQYDAAKRPTPSDILNYPWFCSNEDVKLTEDVMEQFDLFAKRGVLQKALTPLMLEHVKGTDKNLIKYAQSLHANTDKDANGEFDFGEFKQCMAHIGDDKVRSDDELKRIFDSIDADGSGEVSLKEFMAWFSYDYVLKQDERMWGFIKTLDKNNDGKITLDEIEDALKKKNKNLLKYMDAFNLVLKPGEMYEIEYFAKLLLEDEPDRIGGTDQPSSIL
jgi:Ca2+-binding EF-hand superfamily protein